MRTGEARPRIPLDLLLAPLLLVLLAWLGLLSLDAASPVPQSDESLHLSRLLELEQLLRRTHGTAARAAAWLFSGDAYPNGLYAPSLVFILRDHTIHGARLTVLAFGLVHSAVALVLGRRVWGAAGAWAYAILVFASPVALAYLRMYLLDVPLVATVGVAILAAEASEGFRRPLPSFLFAAAAVLGLYVKWTWAAFCAVPVAIAVAQAIADTPSWSRRLGWVAALAGVSAAVVWGVVSAGHAWMRVDGRSAALACVLASVGVAVAWLVGMRRGLSARMNLLFVTLVVGGVAGPWYALVWGSLWGRYSHEQDMYTARTTTAYAASIETIRLLVPLGEGLLVVGLLVALLGKRGRISFVGRLVGGAAAAAVIIRGLPADPRYLLPLLPVIAGAIISGWGAFPRAGIAGAVGIGLTLAGVAIRPDLLPLRPGEPPAMPIEVRTFAGLPVGVLTDSPSPATPDQVRALTDALRSVCPSGPCTFGWAVRGAGGRRLTGRDVQALGKWAGIALEVFDVDATGALPGGRVANGTGVTLCPPDSTFTRAADTGWDGDRWGSGELAGGCRVELRR